MRCEIEFYKIGHLYHVAGRAVVEPPFFVQIVLEPRDGFDTASCEDGPNANTAFQRSGTSKTAPVEEGVAGRNQEWKDVDDGARGDGVLSEEHGRPQPDGFASLPAGGLEDFAARNLALFIRADGGLLSTGFRVEQSHLNGGGICHGGAVATFADVHMALAVMFQTDLDAAMLPTINLSLDYLSAGRPGEWVQATGEILRQTRNLVFAQTIVRADDRAIARASAVYKIGDLNTGKPGLGARLREVLNVA